MSVKDGGNGSSTSLKKFLVRHPLFTFLLMGGCFLVMGIISLNLVYLFHANFEFISEYGVMALREGGLIQFIGLAGSGYVALVFYVLFKACEKALVEWLTERQLGKHTPSDALDKLSPSKRNQSPNHEDSAVR